MDQDALNMNTAEIISKLNWLEKRISQIENKLGIIHESSETSIEKEPILKTPATIKETDSLEYQIGQYWFAKMGVVVFVIGFMFLLSLPYTNVHPIVPAVIGYFCGLLLMFSSRFFKESFPLISGYLVGSSLVLFYFTTLRLHYFSSNQLIENINIEVFLLIIVVAVNAYISIKRKSNYLFNFSMLMGYITAIVMSSDYYLFIINTIMVLVCIYFSKKYNWKNTLIVSIVLTYFTHFVWFINNPFLTSTMKLVYEPQTNIIFILVYLLLFSFVNIFDIKTFKEDNLTIFTTALNIFLGYILLIAVTLHFRETTFELYHFIAFVCLLILSIIYWVKLKSKYSTFYFAMAAYLALSLAIVNHFSAQDYFMWLCWQSLLVISTAVWFKSKHIILANFIIYIFLIVGSIITGGIVKTVGLHFGIVALLSARILNWQKSNLELKTEYMRNAYLITALLVIPLSLYHIIPAGYVSIAWIGVSVIYYLLSIWLKSIKYRWMAVTTLIMTCIYVVILGMTSEDLSSKIYSFLILGSVLVIISIWYARKKNKQVGGN